MKYLILFLLFSQISLAADPPFICPLDNCQERGVADLGDDGGQSSFRTIVNRSCRTEGNDFIYFETNRAIHLDKPIIIPENCQGEIIIHGYRVNGTRQMIKGHNMRIRQKSFVDNCMIRVDDDQVVVRGLDLVKNKNENGNIEKFPGIGLCLIGNQNHISDIRSGVLTNSQGEYGNDIGVYIEGNENSLIGSRISESTLDGILIRGSKNSIQGNYLGKPYIDCEKIEKSKLNQTNSNDDEIYKKYDPKFFPFSSQSIFGLDHHLLLLGFQQFPQSSSQCLISNGRHGIHIVSGTNNFIGGFDTQDHNIFNYNRGAGVRVSGNSSSIKNTIQNNVFYKNHGLGIDLGEEGVTLNDKQDFDVGPNRLINFPENLRVIMRQRRINAMNVYRFTLLGTAPIGSHIEVYLTDGGAELLPLNEIGDPSGFGEGESPLMDFVNESENFRVELPPHLFRGTKITTLLTDEDGNTSEFSQNLILEQDSDLDGIIDLIEDRIWNERVDEGESDPYDIDSDDDGLLDGVEDVNLNGRRDPGELSAFSSDSDGDKISDYIETRGDGIFNPDEGDSDPLNSDMDCDGLMDGEEDANQNGIIELYLGETDPRKNDTDGDGVLDGDGCGIRVFEIDNCPTIPNPDQRDENDNGIGDECEMRGER